MSFSGKTFEATPAESLPVDLMSEKDFSELTKGVQVGAQGGEAEAAGGEARQAEAGRDPAPKVTEKKEVKATAEKTPQPQPLPKPDPIAEKLKKTDEPKKEAKTEPQPLPPKKPPQKQQPKFDADKIAALLDKRDPQRNAATGAELNSTAFARPVDRRAAASLASGNRRVRRRMSMWTSAGRPGQRGGIRGPSAFARPDGK